MAPLYTTQIFLLLIIFASLCSSLEGRKLLIGSEKQNNKKVKPSSTDSLFLASLPKGTVHSSAPSKRGNSVEVDEKLVARHLISNEPEVRILLRSVPSPGAGH
ncbi:precursor of CEP14-like [Vicia villosa]|uniref:precursor of CEP14-like n=1 Tax=Vicia villosa TaxID=3911 RepID=UPI00273B5C31|nr:precursor of CEP14-like [Vicia villosa]